MPLSSSALKKDFNFAYIFELLLSSRFKKQCQMLEWIYSKTAETYHVACRHLVTTVILSFQWQNCLEETNFIISLQKGWEIHNTNYLKLKDWPSLIIRDIWLLIFFLQSRGRPKTLWLYHWFGLSSFFNLFFWFFMYFGYSCWESQCYFVRLSLTEKKKRWVLNPMETLHCLHYQIFFFP